MPTRANAEFWRKDRRQIFGWKREDGTRLYRTVFIEVSRKWGKSEFAAGLAGKLLLADNEPGAEVISAAADREQAAIVLERLKAMVGNNATLSKRTKVYRKEIKVPKSIATYRARVDGGEASNRGRDGTVTSGRFAIMKLSGFGRGETPVPGYRFCKAEPRTGALLLSESFPSFSRYFGEPQMS